MKSVNQATSIMPNKVSKIVMDIIRDLDIRTLKRSAIAGMNKIKNKKTVAGMLLNDMFSPFGPYNTHIMT